MPVAIEEELTVYKGEQRDVMQLTELLRDGLAVQEVINALRGRDREQVEAILGELVRLKGEQRDVMQLTTKANALDPDLYRALNHLVGNRSSYLGGLVRLAGSEFDWRRLLLPARF